MRLATTEADIKKASVEVGVYKRLAHLQGKYVPRLLAHGSTLGGAAYFVGTEFMEVQRPKPSNAGEGLLTYGQLSKPFQVTMPCKRTVPYIVLGPLSACCNSRCWYEMNEMLEAQAPDPH